MHPPSNHFWSRYFLSGLILWAVLIWAFGVYLLFIPRGLQFGLPLEPQDTFFLLGGVCSAGYVVLLLVIALVIAFIRSL